MNKSVSQYWVQVFRQRRNVKRTKEAFSAILFVLFVCCVVSGIGSSGSSGGGGGRGKTWNMQQKKELSYKLFASKKE